MRIRRLVGADRSALSDLLAETREFNAAEVEVALELIDATLEGDGDYEVLVAEDEARTGGERVTGYVCFGPTSMTDSTFDLYWIAVRPSLKGQGVGRKLVAEMEAELRRRGGKQIRVETESSQAYDATRAFYDRIGYERLSVFADFYRPGVDLVTYRRAL